MQLWQPTSASIRRANVTSFMRSVQERERVEFWDFQDFYDWTIREPAKFWSGVWDFCGIVSSQSAAQVINNAEMMPGSHWFPGAKLNFAENLLRFRDDQIAVVFWGEDRYCRRMTYAELYGQVSLIACALKDMGVGPGDRVAAVVPNIPEAIIAMLATASLGAVWSSCSPDFGVSAVVDRFAQISPRVLLVADGYLYKGKNFDTAAKTKSILKHLPSVKHLIVANYLHAQFGEWNDGDEVRGHAFDRLLHKDSPPELEFVQVPFNDPLYVMFSSGTTGKPKCIVHSVGGTLIEHLKELVLHTDLRRSDTIFFATTCGWMMWNWLASSLAVGATIVLYDGAVNANDMQVLFDLADEEQVTVFGTSAGFLSAINKLSLRPRQTHRLQQLRSILSTGSPLAPENFDYVYTHVKEDVLLASISGGTDIIGCFALGCPVLPVHRGELQTRSLGCAVDVFDDAGRAIVGEMGELVCTRPFPSMPTGFWNDPDGKQYECAYFSRYKNVWHHGDWVMLKQHGGMVFQGRSDTVLNPKGVRIGTAEIYQQLEPIDEVVGSVVVGQQWGVDTRIVLFVKLQPGLDLDDRLRDCIWSTIRENTSPRHAPAKIIQVDGIPITRSGKVSEVAVRETVHGRPVKNVHALANPETLEQYRDRIELRP